MTIVELWDELGVDSDEVSARFVGNMDLATRCTKKYIEDATFSQLEKAISENDYNGIEIAAHTLKGVAGNLGFNEVERIGQKMVSDIRAGSYEDLKSDFDQLEIQQQRICELAKQL